MCTYVISAYIHVDVILLHTYSAVSAPQQQPTDQSVSTRDDNTNKPASASTDASVPLPTKTAETSDAVSPSDDESKKPAEASEHDEIAMDKPAEPSVSGKSVVSEKDTKEHSEKTSQTESTKTTPSAVVTLPQQPGEFVCLEYIELSISYVCT